jgi:hypothetical protein
VKGKFCFLRDHQFFILFLLKHFNGHIRADSPAHRAARAFLQTIEDDKVVTLLVEVLRKQDQFFRASGNAKLAPLAPFLVDDDPSHSSFPFLVAIILCSMETFLGELTNAPGLTGSQF